MKNSEGQWAAQEKALKRGGVRRGAAGGRGRGKRGWVAGGWWGKCEVRRVVELGSVMCSCRSTTCNDAT
jgi:hypothetical protein